ncbi:MAG: hypothetical protein ABH824_02540 [Nanoarchaeota archaeon]|nr:hypothetical protein [Nanoarchaeota archaeon]MBU1632649.1 hypothetical protein [Nanoarchaeota archaeon]MBU1876128.1 hypothetical protein [Nanoarchaeota archaeon]
MVTYKAKSVVVSRKPGKDREGLWTAFIGLFDENNPHLKAKVPFKVLEIPNVEKIRIRDLFNVSYYLMGNDIVINNLKELNLETENGITTLTGKQILK